MSRSTGCWSIGTSTRRKIAKLFALQINTALSTIASQIRLDAAAVTAAAAGREARMLSDEELLAIIATRRVEEEATAEREEAAKVAGDWRLRSQRQALQVEVEQADKALNSSDAAAAQQYLQNYPEGRFVEAVRAHLASLTQPRAPIPAPVKCGRGQKLQGDRCVMQQVRRTPVQRPALAPAPQAAREPARGPEPPPSNNVPSCFTSNGQQFCNSQRYPSY